MVFGHRVRVQPILAALPVTLCVLTEHASALRVRAQTNAQMWGAIAVAHVRPGAHMFAILAEELQLATVREHGAHARQAILFARANRANVIRVLEPVIAKPALIAPAARLRLRQILVTMAIRNHALVVAELQLAQMAHGVRVRLVTMPAPATLANAF